MKGVSHIAAALFLWLIAWPALAQQSVLSSTGDALGSGGTSSYSVGQTAFHTHTAAIGTLTEGVQQPYEILFMTGLEDPGISLRCQVNPNPAVTRITLTADLTGFSSCRFELRDGNGILLETSGIEAKETEIRLGERPAGIYLLTLFEKNRILATWKVIKK